MWDFLEFLFSLGELIDWLRFWRFLLCFAGAVALAGWIHHRLPAGVIRTGLAVVSVTAGATVGLGWERIRRRR